MASAECGVGEASGCSDQEAESLRTRETGDTVLVSDGRHRSPLRVAGASPLQRLKNLDSDVSVGDGSSKKKKSTCSPRIQGRCASFPLLLFLLPETPTFYGQGRPHLGWVLLSLLTHIPTVSGNTLASQRGCIYMVVAIFAIFNSREVSSSRFSSKENLKEEL
jgi:hypothetical protein